ncbi:hypothetical protein CPC08DRAFT_346166 [Agrocybe pediades]|nr:hypothetical protein CPC08DRAFT_346166 [Agrocybe pediades]
MSQFTVLNEESSIQQPETSISSSKPGQRAPTTRHRLTEAATQYLEECFIKHQGQMPDIRTREALAIEIQKIPGNGHVKQIHVYNYFTRRSTKQQSQSQTMPACDRRKSEQTNLNAIGKPEQSIMDPNMPILPHICLSALYKRQKYSITHVILYFQATHP